MQRHAAPCSGMQRYAALCSAIQRYALYTTQRYATLCSAVQPTALYHTALCSAMLCAAPCSVQLRNTPLAQAQGEKMRELQQLLHKAKEQAAAWGDAP